MMIFGFENPVSFDTIISMVIECVPRPTSAATSRNALGGIGSGGESEAGKGDGVRNFFATQPSLYLLNGFR